MDFDLIRSDDPPPGHSKTEDNSQAENLPFVGVKRTQFRTRRDGSVLAGCSQISFAISLVFGAYGQK
jgi:hypothetical protein